MPLKSIEPTAPGTRSALRVAVTAAAVVALLFTVVTVVRSDKEPSRDRVETAAGRDPAPSRPRHQRPGRPPTLTVQQPDGPEAIVSAAAPPTTAPAHRPRPTPSTGQAPTAPRPAGTIGTALPLSPSRTPPPTSRSSSSPPSPAPTTTTTVVSVAEVPDPEVSSPAVPDPETSSPAVPGPNVPGPETSTSASTELTDEQRDCATQGVVAIGDNTDGDPTSVAARYRLRAALPQIPKTEGLQCAKPLVRYLDDLLIQRVRAAGQGHGILVGGIRASDPVLWLSEVEWTSYKRMEPPDTTHNFTGVPVERTTIGGHPMIRTSRGAVVMVRSDSWGHTVVSGAWDVWMASGGPTGPMGLPEGIAIKDPQGAHQDFTNGVLKLSGVTSKLEAEVLPASRYGWVSLTAEDLATPPPAPHSIQNVDEVSYYVDRAGVRHWIETTDDWYCAKDRLGAPQDKVPGWQAARAPLGPVFICPPKPPA